MTKEKPTTGLRRLLHRAFPAHLSNPFSLAARLVRTGDRDALYALVNAAFTLGCTPLDVALARFEGGAEKESEPALPVVIVCGAARSGTTLVQQLIIGLFPVAYVDNFTSLFPRSPILARKIFRSRLRNDRIELRSHYGRTARMWGANDGLHFWDRWLGSDRNSVTSSLSPERSRAMARFWGSYESSFGLPVVTKANLVNAHISLVGAALPSATFLVVQRDPLYHAQSLLHARRHIFNEDAIPYGLADPSLDEAALTPYESVAHQVAYAERLHAAAIGELGSERVWAVSYDDFCTDPRDLVARLALLFGQDPDFARLEEFSRNLKGNSKPSLDPAEFAHLEEAVNRICRGDSA